MTLNLRKEWIVAAVTMALLGCLLLTSGCHMLSDEEVVVIREGQTNFVEQISYATNVTTEVVTNDAGQNLVISYTNVVTATNLQPIILPPIFYTNTVISGTAEAGIRGAGRVAGAVGVPGAELASGALLGIAGLVVGWINRRGQRKALAALDESRKETDGLQKAKGMLEDGVAVLTQNIDHLRGEALKIPGYQQHDATVMKAIKAAQRLVGAHTLIDQTRKSGRVLNDKV